MSSRFLFWLMCGVVSISCFMEHRCLAQDQGFEAYISPDVRAAIEYSDRFTYKIIENGNYAKLESKAFVVPQGLRDLYPDLNDSQRLMIIWGRDSAETINRIRNARLTGSSLGPDFDIFTEEEAILNKLFYGAHGRAPQDPNKWVKVAIQREEVFSELAEYHRERRLKFEKLGIKDPYDEVRAKATKVANKRECKQVVRMNNCPNRSGCKTSSKINAPLVLPNDLVYGIVASPANYRKDLIEIMSEAEEKGQSYTYTYLERVGQGIRAIDDSLMGLTQWIVYPNSKLSPAGQEWKRTMRGIPKEQYDGGNFIFDFGGQGGEFAVKREVY